ncbi:MAG: bis(5'-nucleosyl)-tetraphosphatase (symmetrical) YqeK [Candidatus Obscuribacterales bacterium]|nr:bis(5'-nucleosyl)-tetraphosphatase (symmetrical) YqeK [Candidatus Obscuribacterales bacterium]
MSIEGIPGQINIDFVKAWMEPRVSAKRFKHVIGVAKVASKIAAAYGCDSYLAELGGWLHDACKEEKDKVLVQKAREFKIPFTQVEEQYGHLLHGPVGACVVREELGITHEELLAAIAEHTLGNVPMSKLSEVLYLADCLEESRPSDYTAPIWASLSLDDEINVEKAMVTASDLGLLHLMETARPIHPRAVEVRNHYLAKLRARTDLES